MQRSTTFVRFVSALGIAAILILASRFAARVAPGAPAAAAAAPAGGGGAAGAGAWSRIAAPTPPANLLLITLDTTRRDHLSCYGYSKKTSPVLDSLADQGVLFEDAFSAIPVTGPSHSTIMTGLYPFQHGVRHNGYYVLADSFTTMAELLKKKGYDTGAVVAGFPVDHRFGLAQGFDFYDDRFSPISGSAQDESAERPGTEVTRIATQWLSSHGKKPFFLWTHFYDPHVPYHPPEPFFTQYQGDEYAGEIAAMDNDIGQLLAALRKQGLLDNTIIIAVGDHGESLGEHQELTHSMFIYDATQEVPLIMRLPDRAPWAGKTWHHQRVKGQVSLVDILPAAWNALGFAQSDLPAIAGRSLLPIAEGTGPAHEWIYFETLVPQLDYGMSDLRGLQLGEWKYIRAPKQEIYNIEKDPGEQKNLFDKEKDRARDMDSQLAGILASEKKSGAPVAVDKETLEKLRSLGYLQGGPGAAVPTGADPKDEMGVMTAILTARGMDEYNQTAQALGVLDSLLRARPKVPMAQLMRAQYLLKLGRVPESFKAYDALVADCKDCPNELKLRQDQASAYLSAGQPDEALKHVTDLLAKFPKGEGLYLLKGQILERKGDAAGARAAYVQETENWPTDMLPLMQLANLDAGQKRSADAEKSYKKALELNPKSIDVMVALCQLQEADGRMKEAEATIDRALDVDPNAGVAHRRKGWILRETNRKPEALPQFEAAVKRQPNNGVWLYELGSLYVELGREKDALDCYQRAVKLPNAPAGAFSNLGVRAAQAGRLQDAVDLWKQALQRNPTPQEAAVIQNNLQRAQGMLSGQGGGH